MRKTMRLSVRIALAFGSLLVLILVLGAMGVLSMKRVGRLSSSMAKENVPEISLATDIERHALSLVSIMHQYEYTGDGAYLNEVQSEVAAVKKLLQDAKAHGEHFSNLTKLRQSAADGEKAVLDFEGLTRERARITDELAMERSNSMAAGSNFVSICSLFLERQTKAMNGKIQAGIDGDQLDLNLQRINCLVSIVQSGNLLMANTWKAQASRDPGLLQESLNLLSAFDAQLDALEKLVDFETDQKRIADCRVSSQNFRKAVKSFQEKWLEREELAKRQSALANGIIEQARKVSSLGLNDTTTATVQTAGVASFFSSLEIICAVVGLVVGIVVAAFITGKLDKLLRGLATAISESSQEVTQASAQLASSSQSLAEGASEQAAALEETSSSLEELASMTKRNAENARKANELAGEAQRAADKGATDMQLMEQAMVGIKNSSADVANIIRTIDEIAFQTNILALNAAVEAARAGEAGMGFAVVADEVRNLAQRSAVAAKETSAKIEGALSRTAQGVEISAKVREGLQEIVSQVRNVNELVSEVASASNEQSQGITQINTAVGEMDKVTQSNAAEAEESASAAASLNSQSESMKHSVRELMQLVGSDTATNTQTGTALSQNIAKPARQPVRVAANGNGHREKQPVGLANRRDEISAGGAADSF
jgi:methyl-accepting chemotaxis protein